MLPFFVLKAVLRALPGRNQLPVLRAVRTSSPEGRGTSSHCSSFPPHHILVLPFHLLELRTRRPMCEEAFQERGGQLFLGNGSPCQPGQASGVRKRDFEGSSPIGMVPTPRWGVFAITLAIVLGKVVYPGLGER
jgi:hypothetical protein